MIDRAGWKRSRMGLCATVAGLLAAVALCPASSGSVRILDTSHGKVEPCGRIYEGKFALEGGCWIEGFAQDVGVNVTTPVGAFRYATCDLILGLRVDTAGRVRAETFSSIGSKECDYVTNCYDGATAASGAPFPGRVWLDRRRQLRLRVDMCLYTAVGTFQGSFVAGLSDEQGLWTTGRRELALGSSGWAFVGTWRFKRDIRDRADEHDRSLHLSVSPR